MSKVIDLGARFKTAFGFVASNESKTLKDQKFSESNGISGVGVYVSNSSFEQLTIKKTEQDFLTFSSKILDKDGSGVFAPPPMMSFSKSKKLIITEIDGSDAEVVERYGNKSWEIKIQGILIDMFNHQYPKSELKKLREFFEYNAPFEAEGEMLDDLNIKSIYFTDIEITGVAGYEDTLQYTLTAKSIKPVEFFFVDNKK